MNIGVGSSASALCSCSGRDVHLASARGQPSSLFAVRGLSYRSRAPPSATSNLAETSTSRLTPRSRSRSSSGQLFHRGRARDVCLPVSVLPAASSSTLTGSTGQSEDLDLGAGPPSNGEGRASEANGYAQSDRNIELERQAQREQQGGQQQQHQGQAHKLQQPHRHPALTAFLEQLKRHQSTNTVPPASICSRVLLDHVNNGRWNDLWACYQLLEALQVQLDRHVYDFLWQRAIKEARLENAVSVFRKMGQLFGCMGQREYVTIISKLVKTGKKRSLPQAELAYELWGELRHAWGPMMDVVSWRAGVNSCIECGRLDEALELIQLMRERFPQGPGRGCFNMIIKYHCKNSDMDAAREVLRQRYELGFQPDLISFNTLINGYASIGDLKMARAVLDRAGYEGLHPDVISYSSYIHGAARKGDLGEAQAMLDEMLCLGIQPNEWTYSALLEAQLRCGDLSGAENLLTRMEAEAKIKPNTVMYNIVIRAYGNLGTTLGYGHCLRLLSNMQSAGVQPGVDTYSTLMDSALKAGLGLDSVLDLLEQLKHVGLEPDGVVRTTLMKVYQKQGETHKARRSFNEIKASPNMFTDVLALNMMVHVYASSGDMQAAEAATRDAAEFAHKQGMRPPVEAFNSLIQGYQRLGTLPPMLTTFKRFLRLGGRPHTRMAETVVKACLKYGDARTALQVIRAIQLAGVDVACFQRCRELVYEYQIKVEEGGQSMRKGGKRGEEAMWFERLKWFVGLPNSYYSADWP